MEHGIPHLTPAEDGVLRILREATAPLKGAQIYSMLYDVPVEYAGMVAPHIYNLRRKGVEIHSRRGCGYWLPGNVTEALTDREREHLSYRGLDTIPPVPPEQLFQALDRMHAAGRAEREAISGTAACTERAS